MAVRISIKLLKKNKLLFSYKRAPINTFLFKLNRHIKERLRLRSREKILTKNSKLKSRNDIIIKSGAGLSEKSIAKSAKDFADNNFTFLEDVFDRKSHKILCDSFPDDVFFDSPANGAKFYNWSSDARWIETNSEAQLNSQFFSLHPELRSLYRFLDSDEIRAKIEMLTKTSPARLYSVAATKAKSGSYLAPHIDSIIDENAGESALTMINIIYFLNAGGAKPEKCGGTGIYKDNEFKNPVFIPSTLINSALIYNSTQDFYHGFDVMAPGTFRLALAFQYKFR
jgi:hypothetical protein